MRITVFVVLAERDECHLRLCCLEEVLVGACIAAVMAQLEKVHIRDYPLFHKTKLNIAFGIAHKKGIEFAPFKKKDSRNIVDVFCLVAFVRGKDCQLYILAQLELVACDKKLNIVSIFIFSGI